MAEQLYALTAADVGTLKELIAAWQRGDLGRPLQNSRRVLPERDNVIVGVVDSAIGASSYGTLSIYELTTAGVMSASTRDETVYNLSSVSRTTDEYTVAVRDYKSGLYMAAHGGGSGGGYKKLCRFTLDSALTVSDEYQDATIASQYGDGLDHGSTATITVYNMLTHAAGVYLFEGDSGDAGLAYYDSDTDWIILQMECP